MDLKQMHEWLDQNKANWRPKNFDQWFELCNQKSQHVLDIQKDSAVVLSSQEISAHLKYEIDAILKSILGLLPNYFQESQIDWQQIYVPRLCFNKKTIKTTKHIKNYADKSNLKFDTKLLDEHLAKLGEIYKQIELSSKKTYIKVTGDPLAFIKLGHYDCDKGLSCFATNAMNQDKKYALACHPNAFMILLSDKPINESLEGIKGRGIGTVDDNHICFGNTYSVLKQQGEFLIDFISPNKEFTKQKREYHDVVWTGGVNYNDFGFYLRSKIPLKVVVKFKQEYSSDLRNGGSDYYLTCIDPKEENTIQSIHLKELK